MVQRSRSQKLNGLTSLAYLGVMPSTPSNFTIQQRAPTSNDWRNHYIGDVWLDNSSMYPPPGTTPTANNIWLLVSLSGNQASWINYGSGEGMGAVNFLTDSGTAIVNSNNITIHGGSNLNTSGTASTVTVNLNNSISVSGSIASGTTMTAGSGLTVTLGGITVSAGGATITGVVTLPTVYGGSVGATNQYVIIDSTGKLGSTGSTSGAGPGGVSSWTDVMVGSFQLAVNMGYTANFGTLCTLTLPASAMYGTVIRVVGKGAGGWSIVENAGQKIIFGVLTTTTTSGSLSSSQQYDVVELLCTVANSTWTVLSSIGNLTVV